MFRLPCISCGSTDVPKPIRTKVKNGKTMFSRSSKCKICVREDFRIKYERIKKDPEKYKKLLEANKRWAKKNKIQMSEYQHDWEIMNREKRRRKKREYYLKNRERILARNKIWKKANRKPRVRDNSEHVWRALEVARIYEVVERNPREVLV
jgi:hypothetical protein